MRQPSNADSQAAWCLLPRLAWTTQSRQCNHSMSNCGRTGKSACPVQNELYPSLFALSWMATVSVLTWMANDPVKGQNCKQSFLETENILSPSIQLQSSKLLGPGGPSSLCLESISASSTLEVPTRTASLQTRRLGHSKTARHGGESRLEGLSRDRPQTQA